MSLMVFEAFVYAGTGSVLILWILVNVFRIDFKTLSTNTQTVVSFYFFVLLAGMVISGVISGATALFWWLVS